MCLYPKLIINPKYTATKKNGGNTPPIKDHRVKFVPIGCQNCIECMKKKAREWQIRLQEHIKHNKDGKFITLTFSDESIKQLTRTLQTNSPEGKQLRGYNLDNAIATLAVRRFLERYRKKNKRSLTHWLVTELGHDGTNNIHIHGIIWTTLPHEQITSYWQYGHTKLGNGQTHFVNQITTSYITKYITKKDATHKHFKAKILTSPGIGHQYTKTYNATANNYNGPNTKEWYRTSTGHKIALPIYWRNKIYTEQQREQLWLHKLDKGERWIMRQKFKINTQEKEFYLEQQYWQHKNRILGYGDDRDWQDKERKQYEQQCREINLKTRIARANASGGEYSKGSGLKLKRTSTKEQIQAT